MNLDKNTHRRVMLQILADISSDVLLANNLGFKGGTACYFVHGLDRFSVDLDFDILDRKRAALIQKRLITLLRHYGEVKTRTSIKVKYSGQYQALKIDLSSRHDTEKFNTYEILEIASRISVKVLKKEDIFAHKLIALTDRNCAKGEKPVLANRDLYDIYFFFQNNWTFNENIIQTLTGKSTQAYLQYASDFIEKYVNEANILDRLGELVDNKKRIWVKNNLKDKVLTQLAIQIELLKT